MSLPYHQKDASNLLKAQGVHSRYPTVISILPIPGALYCDETTLHGFHYLVRPGLVSKLLWALTIVACLGNMSPYCLIV